MAELERLPQFAAAHVAQWLEVRDVLALSAASRRLRGMMSEADVWRLLAERCGARVPWEPHLSDPCPRLAFKEAMLYKLRFKNAKTIHWGGRRVRVHVRLMRVSPALSASQATQTIFGIEGRAIGEHQQYGSPTLYRLHKVYDERATAAAVFEGSAFKPFRALISGVDSAIVVAGANDSDKKATLLGNGEPGAQQLDQGLAMLLCEKVLSTMQAEQRSGYLQRFELRLSVVQICSQRGTEVFDLLARSPNTRVEVRATSDATAFELEPRALKPVANVQDVHRLLNRARSAAALRDGHVVATLHLTQVGHPDTAAEAPATARHMAAEAIRLIWARQPVPEFGARNGAQAPPPTTTAQLSLVSVSASQDKDLMMSRADLQRVVKTVNCNGRGSFRDSLLNKMLQSCLSSHAGVTLLITASPAHRDSKATGQYLRFGCEVAGWKLARAHSRFQDESISRFLREEAMSRQALVGPAA